VRRVPVESRVATYGRQTVAGRTRTVHRIRAERALGKALPEKAIVHHADGSTRDDAPLVICQDDAYHKLLHVRMRVVRAGADPNTHRFCASCNSAKPFSDFNKCSADKSTGLFAICRSCHRITCRSYARNFTSAIKASRNIERIEKQ